jgi:hypothetical protein
MTREIVSDFGLRSEAMFKVQKVVDTTDAGNKCARTTIPKMLIIPCRPRPNFSSLKDSRPCSLPVSRFLEGFPRNASMSCQRCLGLILSIEVATSETQNLDNLGTRLAKIPRRRRQYLQFNYESSTFMHQFGAPAPT